MPETAMEPLPVTVALMVTRRCNMACAHCSVASSSKIREQPSPEDLEKWVNQIGDSGVKAVLFTGGEPMLREKLLLRLMTVAKKRGLYSAITTNGFWGKSFPLARRTLASLCKSGLTFFTLSYDRYHAEFQGPENGQNILRAAEELGVPMNLNVTRIADDSELSDLIRPFETSSHAKVRLYDVQPAGRAADLPRSDLRAESFGACDGARLPAITDDGQMTACNGPSYFQPDHSPLRLGSLRHSTVKSLLERHRDDPILQTIRIFGPSRLREELSRIPGFADFPWKKSYAGLCDLCLHINSSKEAAAALRARLSEPKLVAERLARARVKQGMAERGRSGRLHSTGPGSARIWISAARGDHLAEPDRWASDAERIFGRSDADWRQITEYIAACGLSRIMLPIVKHPAISRWAPAMLSERLSSQALREGRRELVQRAALEIIDNELRGTGERGVLLKGAAFIAREMEAGADPAVRFSARTCNDIDVLVDERAAQALWTRLSRRGGNAGSPGQRTGPHHLPPVLVNGVPVEIHARVMPAFWRLPEKEMLARAMPLAKFASLSTLDAEGTMLHTLMHCAAHMFGFGLKTAWDISWILERHPDIDIARLRRWADDCSMPAGFYLPASVLRSVLDVPVPPELCGSFHDESRYAAIERVLRQRMFIAMEETADINPITKHGTYMLLHNSWTGRTRHIVSLFGKHERESRVAARNSGGPLGGLSAQFRQSRQHLKRFRVALADARAEARDERAFLFADA